MRLSTAFFSFISFFGLPLFYLPAIAALWLFDWRMAIRLAYSLVTIEIVGALIKFFYAKERPEAMPRRNILERIDASSFPSIHAGRVCSVAFFSYKFHPGIPMAATGILFVAAVAWSRLALKKHYPIDVLGGIVLGLASSWIVSFT